MITKDTVNGLMETVRNLYLADDIPWGIGYSGGKDSTAALQLVWLAIEGLPEEERKKTIHIINTDTLVESPVVANWAHTSLRKMDEISQQKHLPFVTHILNPNYDDTFWVNLLGRGYPFPRKKFRWCTDRLKIEPVNNFIKAQIAENGEIILVLGTRKAESLSRRRHMEHYEKLRVRELLSPNPTLANELVFSPLEGWTNDDVWIFLMQYKNPWGYSNNDLLTLYRGATADNECPLMVSKNLPSCGKSRFGCWVCTMVDQDKSMAAMITNDEEKAWLTPMLEFRNEFGDESKDRDRRNFRRRNGSLQGSYQRLYHGPYKKEVREAWLKRLLEVQVEINQICPPEYQGIELISLPELRIIRRIWVNENHEFEDTLPGIYEEVTGKPFDDPEWIGIDVYGKKEWELLRKTCQDFYPDEELVFEMAYSLLDIENKSYGLSQRKGIIDSLNKAIRRTFYKDENDAYEYYSRKMQRERDLGGKVKDELFLQDYKAKISNNPVEPECEDVDI